MMGRYIISVAWVGGVDDEDDDIYIMMKCVSVCNEK